MITSLHLNNFRCFRNFSLDQTARITLIGGKNNVGKTTFLESIFLLFAYNNPDIFIKINILRKNLLTSFSPDITWEHLFYNKDVSKDVGIEVYNDGKHVKIAFQREDTVAFTSTFVPVNQDLRMPINGYPLKIIYTYGEKQYIGHCFPLQNGMTINWESTPQNNLLPIVRYIGIGSDAPENLAVQFGHVVKSGQKQQIIDVLKLLDPELEDISTVAEDIPRLYIQKGTKPLLPLSVMGNGISRLMQILCSILEYPGGIVLIDEVEVGFHHTFFPHLWKSIGFLAKKMDVQVFATTHSYECVQDAVSSLPDKEEFCYIRLNKEGDDVIPYIFPDDVLQYSFEQNIEIR